MDHNNNKKSAANKWDEIDENILLKIIASFTIMELVFSISRVCRTWRSVVKVHCNQLKKLNLATVGKKPVLVTHQESWCNASGEFSTFVRHLPNPAVSNENLTGLAFDISPFATNSKLLYVAQRCPNLKNLELPFLPNIAEERLAFAFKTWPKLESLAISFSTDAPSQIVLQSIGQHCRNLKSLRFRAIDFFKETALNITNFMPNLEILSFSTIRIQPQAVIQVLKNSSKLQEMHIAHKAYNDLKGFGTGGIIILTFFILLQNEEVVREARRLRVFHVCKNVYCDECHNKLDDIEFM